MAVAASRAARRVAAGREYRAKGYWNGSRVDDGLRATAAADPDRLALVDRDRRVSYGELDAAVDRAAAMLVRLGVRPGDVVSFQLPNWVEAAVVFHATARVGGVCNPIVPIYRGREVGFILRQARSRVLVIPDRFRGFDHRAMVAGLRGELPDLEHVLVVGDPAEGGRRFADEQAVPATFREPARVSSEPVLLLYTSGTEAQPKGVVHTHDTLEYDCRSIREHFALTASDVILMASPVTHITGLAYGLELPFGLGARSVLLDVWSPGAALKLIEQEGCSFTVGATPFLHGLLGAEDLDGRDISSLRTFLCGGADIPPGLIRAAAQRTAMLATRVYGSTECPIVTATPVDAPPRDHAETDGVPIFPTEARLVDDDGAVLTPPATGNLQVRGPDLCIGYRDPALDDAAFTDDGWLRTGDLAAIDGRGAVRIAGRVKDIIVRGGENLSVTEIEGLLFDHPDITEVAVVGFPDEVLGERVCAYVVSRRDLTLAEIAAFLRARGVANQKLPERLCRVDALPKTPSGKVQKFQLRAEQRRSP